MIASASLCLAATSNHSPAQQQPSEATPQNSDAGANQQGAMQPATPLPLAVTGRLELTSNQDAQQRDSEQRGLARTFWDFNLTDALLVVFTGALVMVGYRQWQAMKLQVKKLNRTIKNSNRDSERQAGEMAASIKEASRSALAMEGVATSMAENAQSMKVVLVTNREIADRQKLITELQSRAYLAVNFLGIVPQNADTQFRFEPRMNLINLGNTPAHKVKFRTAADVLPNPLPDDFDFPLRRLAPSASLSVMGPRITKIVTAVAPRIYSDDEVEQIKGGAKERLVMWGIIDYEDVFGILRYVKFCQTFVWLSDGVTPMGFDTRHHNDSD